MNFSQNPRNKFLLLSTSVIVGVLAVVGVVSAATTIGTSIQTDGNLTVVGNVGIATTSPAYPLDVNGTARTGNLIVNGAWPVLTINDTTLNENFQIQYHESHNALEFYNPGGTYTPIQIYANGNLNLAREGGPLVVTVGTFVQGASRLNVSGGTSIGAGYVSNAAPTNGMIVQGNVGIGTTSPTGKLQVFNSSDNQLILDASGQYTSEYFNNNGTTKGGFYFDNTNNKFVMGAFGNSSTVTQLTYGTGGVAMTLNNANVGLSTTSPWRTLSVNGTVGFDGLTTATQGNYLCLNTTTKEITSGTTCTLSSERFKTNITPLAPPSTLDNTLTGTPVSTSTDPYALSSPTSYPTSALAEVMALQPVTFTFKPGYGDNGSTTQLGFIAEQAVTVDPRLVPLDATGQPAGFFYQNYTAVLTKAMQEEQAEIASLAHLTNNDSILSATSTPTTPLIWHDDSSPLNTAEYDANQIINGVITGVSRFEQVVADTVTAHVVKSDSVQTSQLCVGSTCVTPDQFLKMLQTSGATASTPDTEQGTTISATTDTSSVPTPVQPATTTPVVSQTATSTATTTSSNPHPEFPGA